MEVNLENKITGLQKSLESMMTYVQLKSKTTEEHIEKMGKYIQENQKNNTTPLNILAEHRMAVEKAL